eukprot:scaffold6297_cov69-Cyclotella_meneghiniana.AAC.4
MFWPQPKSLDGGCIACDLWANDVAELKDPHWSSHGQHDHADEWLIAMVSSTLKSCELSCGIFSHITKTIVPSLP